MIVQWCFTVRHSKLQAHIIQQMMPVSLPGRRIKNASFLPRLLLVQACSSIERASFVSFATCHNFTISVKVHGIRKFPAGGPRKRFRDKPRIKWKSLIFQKFWTALWLHDWTDHCILSEVLQDNARATLDACLVRRCA